MAEQGLGFAGSLVLPDRDGSAPGQAGGYGWVPAAPPGTPVPALLGHLARREATRVGGSRGSRRLPLRPGSLRTGARAALRRWAYSGVVTLPAEEGFPSPRSPLGRVAAAAEVEFTTAAFWPASGGSFVAPATWHGTPAVLRVFAASASERHADAERTLLHLEQHAMSRVPRLLTTGSTEGLPWLVESRLPGRRPRRLAGPLVDGVLDFCVALPPAPRPAVAAHEHLPAVLEPGTAAALHRVGAAAAAHWSGTPAVGTHGDLWEGNLLQAGGGLGGVVDWDAYRSDEVPGVDLFHLLATAERLRHRRSMGAELLSRPWARDPLRSVASAYFDRLGLTVDEDRWTATGVGWWMGQLVDTLARTPELARDEAWTSRNIEPVLRALG